MSLRREKGWLALALALVGVLAIGAMATIGPADAAKRKVVKVKVGDDYFAPSELKVKKGTKVKWKWLKDNGNPHNVTLEKGPKGVSKKDFSSKTGTIGITFAKVMKKPGTYDFVCTIHSTVMTQTVKVKRG